MEMKEIKAEIKDMSVTITSTTVGTRMMYRLEMYCTPMNNIWIS